MTPQDWEQIRYFSPKENWGDPYKMEFGLIWLLDSFREFHGRPIFISMGTQGKHSPNSMHYVGKAVDLIIECGKSTKLDVILSLFRFPFTGLGIYPDWQYHKFSRSLGVHLDCRVVTSLPRGITQAQWIGIKKPHPSDENEYHPLCEDMLRRYRII